MRYLILLLFLTGCTTKSDYWHGCDDALFVANSEIPSKLRSQFCDRLEYGSNVLEHLRGTK